MMLNMQLNQCHEIVSSIFSDFPLPISDILKVIGFELKNFKESEWTGKGVRKDSLTEFDIYEMKVEKNVNKKYKNLKPRYLSYSKHQNKSRKKLRRFLIEKQKNEYEKKLMVNRDMKMKEERRRRIRNIRRRRRRKAKESFEKRIMLAEKDVFQSIRTETLEIQKQDEALKREIEVFRNLAKGKLDLEFLEFKELKERVKKMVKFYSKNEKPVNQNFSLEISKCCDFLKNYKIQKLSFQVLQMKNENVKPNEYFESYRSLTMAHLNLRLRLQRVFVKIYEQYIIDNSYFMCSKMRKKYRKYKDLSLSYMNGINGKTFEFMKFLEDIL